jgi:hypothetical protein
MTESVAAAYLSLAPNDFARDVETGRLPPPRRTAGGDRWSRRDLDARFEDGPVAGTDARDMLGAAIDAWSRP